MSDIKCPICKSPLQPIGDVDTKYPTTNYYCPNNCIPFAFGNLPMWKELKQLYDSDKELIRTRKALDDAKKWLMKIGYLDMTEHGLGSEKMMTDWCKTVALHGLKEIKTALEQKDEQ